MNNKTCFFIGSRHTSYSISEQLAEVIDKHITEYKVTSFTVGHYGNFDHIVTGVLKEAKKRYASIKLYLLAPYALNQNIEAPEGFDGTFYAEGLETVPFRYAIIQANHYMVNHSDYLIAHPGTGNSRNLVEYAKKREKKGEIKITFV